MASAVKFIGWVISVVGIILSFIVSYHVVQAAAPEWLSTWWMALVLILIGGVVQGLGSLED